MKMTKKGLTLIELVLTVALISIVMQVLFSVFLVGNTSYSYSKNRGFSQQAVRSISDFLTKELRYVTRITTDINEAMGETSFYSLKVELDSGEPVLVRRMHKYLEDSVDDYVETNKKEITGDWTTLRIINSQTNMLDIQISQSEGSGNSIATYELPLAIDLGNSGELSTGIDIDLMDIENNAVLYYQKAEDANLKAKIDFDTNTNSEDDESNSGSIDWTSLEQISIVSYEMYEIKKNRKLDSSVEGNTYTFRLGSNGNFTGKLVLGINYSKEDNNNIPVELIVTQNSSENKQLVNNVLAINQSFKPGDSISFLFRYKGYEGSKNLNVNVKIIQ